MYILLIIAIHRLLWVYPHVTVHTHICIHYTHKWRVWMHSEYVHCRLKHNKLSCNTFQPFLLQLSPLFFVWAWLPVFVYLRMYTYVFIPTYLCLRMYTFQAKTTNLVSMNSSICMCVYVYVYMLVCSRQNVLIPLWGISHGNICVHIYKCIYIYIYQKTYSFILTVSNISVVDDFNSPSSRYMINITSNLSTGHVAVRDVAGVDFKGVCSTLIHNRLWIYLTMTVGKRYLISWYNMLCVWYVCRYACIYILPCDL
jgi:hypothetical protein